MAGSVTRYALTVTLTVSLSRYPESGIYGVVEQPELGAEFCRGFAHDGDVLADELADHFDERAHRTAGADDDRHPTRRATVADRLEQPGLVDAQPLTEPDG